MFTPCDSLFVFVCSDLPVQFLYMCPIYQNGANQEFAPIDSHYIYIYIMSDWQRDGSTRKQRTCKNYTELRQCHVNCHFHCPNCFDVFHL